jgi:hypothetical protein
MVVMIVFMLVVTVVMQMMGAFDVATARQDEDTSVGMHNVDVSAVKTRQNGGRDHLRYGAQRGMAIAKVKHAIKRTDKLIELVRAE